MKQGNEIGCEKCDCVFEIRKKQPTVKEVGLMERIVRLEKSLEEFMGARAAPDAPADPPGEPAGKKPVNDPFEF